MFRITTLAALLIIPLCSIAQINRPATKPTSTAPPAATRDASPEQPSQSDDGAIAVKQANGIEIKLLRVDGNAADQQVTLTWIMNNPKANANVAYHLAYAVDPEGDEYHDASGGYNTDATLYTDVPKKGFRVLKGVPSKVQTFRLMKFDIWSQATNQWTVVEFRNLKINWR